MPVVVEVAKIWTLPGVSLGMTENRERHKLLPRLHQHNERKTAHFIFSMAYSSRLVCSENYLTWQLLYFPLLPFTTVVVVDYYMNLASTGGEVQHHQGSFRGVNT